MRPWSFWWLKDRTTWAGFFQEGRDPFVGVVAIRPSRWTPYGWDGFEHTELPVTARAGGGLDITLALLAFKPDAMVKPTFGDKNADDVYVQYCYETLSGAVNEPGGLGKTVPLHRELAITAGAVSDYVDLGKAEIQEQAAEAHRQKDSAAWNRLLGEGRWLTRLRSQLVKYSEFPLDEVKDFAFDFTPAQPDRQHPFLLFSQADVDRARRQAQTAPSAKTVASAAIEYITRLGGEKLVDKIQAEPDGWQRFFRENYKGNGLYEHAPIAFVGSDDPTYGAILAAGARGLARENVNQFLSDPHRPCIGGNAHLGTTGLLRLLLAYDALAGTDYLTAEQKKEIRAVLVFGAYVTDHPDYWSPHLGISSANPNMTSLMKLPLGLLALFLDDHPRSAQWVTFAEEELHRELSDAFIAPGGAWLECPFYQGPSLDGMFLLSQALKNVKGEDYFSHPMFRAMMDCYGFILTPPDVRFPTKKADGEPALMTVPSIGDAMPGHVTPFCGWMAKATAESDPAYSARQQFYWQGQGLRLSSGGRANAFMAAICDPELPVAPPADLARAFEGLGNILRSSWTDPRASYVSHRNGHFFHHFDPGDPNSIIYFAKGAPLCMDFGHRGASGDAVQTMWRPDYHNTVSFNLTASGKDAGVRVGSREANRETQDVRNLPRTLGYSAGASYGQDGQTVARHVLLVKSDDPMGANYVLMRDVTQGGQTDQDFFWNLWCLATGVVCEANVAHFPGQFGVDLDAHVLSPANPQFSSESYTCDSWVPVWAKFVETQHGVHVRKQGSEEDFFSVLYPRAQGQGPAQVTSLAGGRAVAVTHMEGTDVALLSPGTVTSVTRGDVRLAGEIAFARRYAKGEVRLAVVKGSNAVAALGQWELSSDGPTAIAIAGNDVEGESSGEAHTVQLGLPPAYGAVVVTSDNQPLAAQRENDLLSIAMPSGHHRFTIRKQEQP